VAAAAGPAAGACRAETRAACLAAQTQGGTPGAGLRGENRAACQAAAAAAWWFRAPRLTRLTAAPAAGAAAAAKDSALPACGTRSYGGEAR
jgi:hypothetical protein